MLLINEKGKNLVFLLSMPRSGSTLLSLMLGSHPEICCPPEPWIVLALAEYLGLADLGSAPYGRGWAEISTLEFLLRPEKKQRGALSKTFSLFCQSVPSDGVTAARRILQAAYQMHLDSSGKSVFVDKTPRYYAILDLIDDLFPQAKKILLLRNPLDVYASYKTTWGTERRIFTPEGVSDHTRDFCEGFFKLADYAAASREDVLPLRYEDLVKNPESVLQRVCEFAGLDFSPAMLAFYENTFLLEDYRRSPVGDPIIANQPEPANSRTVNEWEKRLEKEDIQALIDVLGIRIFDRLGYPDAATGLRNLPVSLPTEEEAGERRKLLMRSLAGPVREEPFSSWTFLVEPAMRRQSDQDRQIDRLKQELAAVRAERDQMRASHSWFVTRPFRFIRRRLSI